MSRQTIQQQMIKRVRDENSGRILGNSASAKFSPEPISEFSVMGTAGDKIVDSNATRK
jgi:hypothetical protein